MSSKGTTSETSTTAKKANYGIDAPGVVKTFLLLGIGGLALGLMAAWASKDMIPWMRFLVPPCGTMGAVFLAQSLVMIWGSKWGKVSLRDRLIAEIPWRGDEQVLDVGCGHGLMLIGAARQLRTGKVIGIDLWQKEDQAGNSREATWRNAQIEKVSDRIKLRDGDARKLPFADNTFDVILSSWALHNIYDAAGRATAIREISRVLKPGGRAVIVDIRHSAEYAQEFETMGMMNVKRTGPNFLFVIPSFIVTATKIGAGPSPH